MKFQFTDIDVIAQFSQQHIPYQEPPIKEKYGVRTRDQWNRPHIFFWYTAKYNMFLNTTIIFFYLPLRSLLSMHVSLCKHYLRVHRGGKPLWSQYYYSRFSPGEKLSYSWEVTGPKLEYNTLQKHHIINWIPFSTTVLSLWIQNYIN